MSRTHTPGPWAITYDPDNGRQLEIVTEANHDGRLAFLASDGRIADASLIVAAPDLLAVCQTVLKVWEEGTRGTTPFPVDELRAAIAKAEGHAP